MLHLLHKLAHPFGLAVARILLLSEHLGKLGMVFLGQITHFTRKLFQLPLGCSGGQLQLLGQQIYFRIAGRLFEQHDQQSRDRRNQCGKRKIEFHVITSLPPLYHNREGKTINIENGSPMRRAVLHNL